MEPRGVSLVAHGEADTIDRDSFVNKRLCNIFGGIVRGGGRFVVSMHLHVLRFEVLGLLVMSFAA